MQTTTGERGEITITIERTKAITRCRKCGQWITKRPGRDEWVVIKHLPVFGRPTYLRYRPNRYQCPDCEGHPTARKGLEWHAPKSPHSFASDNHILLQLVNSRVEDVRIKEGIIYECVLGSLERRIDIQVDWTLVVEIEALGWMKLLSKRGKGNM